MNGTENPIYMSQGYNFPSLFLLGVFDEAPSSAHAIGYDFIIRVLASTDGGMDFHIAGTEEFKEHFSKTFNYFKIVNDTLAEVILSQKKSLEYNGLYNAFLLGQLSEKSFIKKGKAFAYRPKIANIKILSTKINILYNLTNIDYTPSELADAFQCNLDDITAAIKSITHNKLLEKPQ